MLLLCTWIIAIVVIIVLVNRVNKINNKLHELRAKINHVVSRIEGVLVRDEDDNAIFVAPDNCISQHIIFKGSWEPHVRNIIKQLAKPKQKVLIFGGHFGTHAMLFSKIVGPEGKVYVFEPNPETFKQLEANAYFSKTKNIVLYEKAAYSENKKLKFIAVLPRENSGGSHLASDEYEEVNPPETFTEITVQAIRADSIPELSNGGIDILQMDIEGAEPQAVFGAKQIIDNSPNLVVIQEWTMRCMAKDAVAYLKFWRERGYRFARITNNSLIEMTDKELIDSPAIDIVISKNLNQLIANFKVVGS